MREAVGGEGVDDAERLAELVVEERAEHAAREGALDIGDLLAHLVPEVRDLGGARRVLEVYEDDGASGRGIALEKIDMRHLLELLLQPVGHLFEHVFDRRAGPHRLHDHRLDGEGRVFVAAEADVGVDPRRHDQDQREPDEDAMAKRPFGKVEAPVHCVSPRSFTFWPGLSAWTPAVTTISPSFRPSPTIAESNS